MSCRESLLVTQKFAQVVTIKMTSSESENNKRQDDNYVKMSVPLAWTKKQLAPKPLLIIPIVGKLLSHMNFLSLSVIVCQYCSHNCVKGPLRCLDREFVDTLRQWDNLFALNCEWDGPIAIWTMRMVNVEDAKLSFRLSRVLNVWEWAWMMGNIHSEINDTLDVDDMQISML